MLKRLYISNFALIDEMDVTFPGHLTVVTGETGAGKSIFLEALGLALGRRADLGAVKNKAKKCIVEAEFETGDLDLNDFFEVNSLDADPHLFLRREIGADGKSRSFLNDSLVSLNVLRSLAEKLIDIHSQHQTLLLNQSGFQLEVVDAFAGTVGAYKDFKAEFSALNKCEGTLTLLLQREAMAKKELDYLQFLYTELEEADIKIGTLKELEEKGAVLENAETILETLNSTNLQLQGGELNTLHTLAQIKQALNSIAKFDHRYQQFYERVQSAYLELKELTLDLNAAAELVTVNETALTEIHARLDKINRLLNKHSVKSEEELLLIFKDLQTKLDQYSSLEKEIEKANKNMVTLKNSCIRKAENLSLLRRKSLSGIEKQVTIMLRDLNMENAQFKVELSSLIEPGPSGLETVQFMFSANKGVALSELQRVASGGELSRLMLSLKALLATKKQLPTILFDEIDAGVSGDVADRIGTILLKMGNTMQVVTITHLPQMASKGEHHLFVYKKDDADKTVSYIKELTKEERITEIAKMLSTSKPTPSALKNAKELLSFN